MPAASKMSLMPNGTPPSKVFFPALLDAPRLRTRCLACKMAPRPYHRLALGDPFETARYHRLRGQPPALDQAEDIGRKQAVRFDIRHWRSPPRRAAALYHAI